MSKFRTSGFVLLVMCIATAQGETIRREPHIGYLYPGGGQRGTVVRIIAGGQFLNGAADVYISGEGINASVVKYYKVNMFNNKDQRELVQQKLAEVRLKRFKELGITPPRSQVRGKAKAKPTTSNKAATPKKTTTSKETTTAKSEKTPANKQIIGMPSHPLLVDIDNKSLKELAHIKDILFFPRRMIQPNRQIAESVVIDITIDPDAKPGNREIRIKTPTGLTNPMVFQVATLPEVRELEPNDDQAYPKILSMASLPKEKPLRLPTVLNGQIMPGDVDRFRFKGQKGQKLVMEAHARSLIPYLSDAVPGWFQATLTLYDDKNNEVAFVDDYRFNPDPVLFYEIPRSGEYELEIRDSIYRGREDFVYRIAISEQPFVTQVFPLGGREHSRASISIDGWNMQRTQLPLDAQSKNNSSNIQRTTYDGGKLPSNPIIYAVDTIAETTETESNNTPKQAQPVTLPIIVNGRIDQPGDTDMFKFSGRRGKKVVAEVYGRRLNSPVDSLLRLTKADGTTVKFNDDYIVKDGYLHKDTGGLTTHHADSYIMAELPENGTYYVHLADSQNQGGKAYGYRLRIAEPKGEFTLRVTPSSLYTYAGGTVSMRVHVLRKDGFDGQIKVALKDPPAGFSIQGSAIPEGCDQIRITLAIAPKVPVKPYLLELQGTALIAGRTVTHTAMPAENMMQAFLYRHLVPSQQLLIDVQKKKWPQPFFKLIGDGPVRIASGDSARVRLKMGKDKVLNNIKLELNQPPKGLTLHDVKAKDGTLSFELKADEELKATGFKGNVIVEGFRKYTPKKKVNNKKAPPSRLISLDFLPAIPIEIVKQ